MLPAYDHVVFDEAHHLEDVATKTFGIDFGSRRLSNLVDRIKHVKGLDIDRDRLNTLEDLNGAFFQPFYQAGKSEFYFEDVLHEESQETVERYARDTCNSIATLQTDLLAIAKDDEDLRDRLEGIGRVCGRTREELSRLMFHADEDSIRWVDVETSGRNAKPEPRVTLHLTPISVAGVLTKCLWSRSKGGAVVMLSATLANSGGFSYQRQRLGIPEDAIECLVGSPFDYKSQAMLYVPGHLPAPAYGADYAGLVAKEIERILRLSEGRAFLLFTSRAMLNMVHAALSERQLPFPLFKQGDLPPGKLIEAFRYSGNGCLMGVQTFWEGVDIQGDALSCVIIDKLPFAVPDSPITKARITAIEKDGLNSFRDYSIPQAQIRLKQGFGRLVRTKDDRGLVCILDSRLVTRDYGAEFVKYLPPAARASKWPRVEKFWQELQSRAPAAEPTTTNETEDAAAITDADSVREDTISKAAPEPAASIERARPPGCVSAADHPDAHSDDDCPFEVVAATAAQSQTMVTSQPAEAAR
jgi:ATP-dependent DNA helicase DinG